MTDLPLNIPLVGKDGRVDMTSPWLAVLRSGISQDVVRQIVVEHVTKTVNDLVAGATGGIPIAANSVASTQIQDNSVLGSNIAQSTITEQNILPGSITGLSMALQLILVSYDTWTDNSPSAGYISWSSFNISYNGSDTTIDAGNTNLTYIYWDGTSNTLTASNTNPILSDGNFMIATNVSGVHSIAYNKIALQQIGAAWIQLASITDAQIASLNAGKITAGSIRSINVQSSTFTTKGSFLTSATVGSDAVVYVDNTVDFPASGSAQIIDPANDRNTFTYTGTTANTLTGCSGVLVHANGMTVIPLGMKALFIDSNVNEMRFFADIGGGVFEEIADIGSMGITGAVGSFGTPDNLNTGVLGQSSTGLGIEGRSVSGYGGKFSGGAGALQLGQVSSLPANPMAGDVVLDGNSNVYVGKQGVSQTVLISAATSQSSPDNGATWVAGTLTSRAWSKPVWNGTVYCMVASGTQISVTSSDGLTWTEYAAALPSSAAWGALVWNGVVYSTIELGTTSTKGATSPDGVTWTARTLPSAVWAAQTTKGTELAIVGTSKSAKSTNSGSTWSSASPALNFFTLGYLSATNVYVAGAINSGIPYWSSDALTWHSGTGSVVMQNDCEITTFNNVIIGVFTITVNGTPYILYTRSVDGKVWFGNYILPALASSAHLDHNGQQFIITIPGSSTAYGSTDALTWHPLTLPASSTWIGLTGFYTSGGWNQLGWSTALVTGANATTSSASFVNIPMNKPVPLLANSTYEFKAQLSLNSSNVNGLEVAIQFSNPGGGEKIEAAGHSENVSVSGYGNPKRITSFGSSIYGVILVNTNDDGTAYLSGVITTGTNAGNLTMQFKKDTNGTATCYIGSLLKVKLIK